MGEGLLRARPEPPAGGGTRKSPWKLAKYQRCAPAHTSWDLPVAESQDLKSIRVHSFRRAAGTENLRERAAAQWGEGTGGQGLSKKEKRKLLPA